MSKERINGRGLQLSEGAIFDSSEWYGLTPLGSCLEGIISVKHDLGKLSNNGMSWDMLREWGEDIEARFGRASELLGVDIPVGQRDNLLEQHKAIVKKRIDSLSRLPVVDKKLAAARIAR